MQNFYARYGILISNSNMNTYRYYANIGFNTPITFSYEVPTAAYGWHT